MITKNNKKKNSWTRPAMIATAALATVAMSGTSSAQSIGDAVRGAVTGGANASQSGANATAGAGVTQSATQRGVNQAVQGVMNGQSVSDAARSGVSEAVRSATGTTQQSQLNNQTQLNNQGLNSQTGANATLNGNGLNANSSVQTGVNWQTDSQGRQYYRDSSGRAIYSGQTQSTVNGNASTQTSQQTGNHSSAHQAMKTEVETLRKDVDRLEAQLKQVMSRLEVSGSTTNN